MLSRPWGSRRGAGATATVDRPDVDLVRSAALSSAELWHEILQRLSDVQESQSTLAQSIEELGSIMRDAIAHMAPSLASPARRAIVVGHDSPLAIDALAVDSPAPELPSDPIAAAEHDALGPARPLGFHVTPADVIGPRTTRSEPHALGAHEARATGFVPPDAGEPAGEDGPPPSGLLDTLLPPPPPPPAVMFRVGTPAADDEPPALPPPPLLPPPPPPPLDMAPFLAPLDGAQPPTLPPPPPAPQWVGPAVAFAAAPGGITGASLERYLFEPHGEPLPDGEQPLPPGEQAVWSGPPAQWSPTPGEALPLDLSALPPPPADFAPSMVEEVLGASAQDPDTGATPSTQPEHSVSEDVTIVARGLRKRLRLR